MAMGAINELEAAAVRHANEAIRLDSQGSRGMAIAMYQKAIEVLLNIVHLYPEYELNKVYAQRAMAYHERIRVLQGAHAVVEPADGNTSPEKPGKTLPETIKADFNELVIKEKPEVTWDDVVGLPEAKRAVRESMVYPVQRPDLFPLGWPRGILLFGPPGCGKTLLAAAVSKEIDAVFYTVDAASIMSKWLGEGEKNVARLFSSARDQTKDGTPAILFIDEIDSLLGARTTEVGGEVRVRNQFLKEMDGVLDKGKGFYVYIIGATNKPWALDWPFIRRFQKRVLVPLPDYDARVSMLKLYTKGLTLSSDVGLGDLAKMTDGVTGSDLKDLCQSAQLRVVRELFESGQASDRSKKPRPITAIDFQEILKERKPSVTMDMMKTYQNWFEMFKAL